MYRYNVYRKAYWRTKRLTNNMGRALKRYKMVTYVIGAIMFVALLGIKKNKGAK